MAIERVRVKDKETGHRFSIVASRFDPEVYERLDEPSSNRDGTPIPPKHHVPKGKRTSRQQFGRAAKKPASEHTTPSTNSPAHVASDQPGQTAESEKENS